MILLLHFSSNYDILHRYSQEGESGAEELISLAYVEGMIWGEIDEKIKNHIEKDINIDLRKRSVGFYRNMK